MYTASCLCGDIQLKIHAEIPHVFVCHCQQCQKAQGSAFVAIAPIETKDLEIVKGQQLFSEYYATTSKKPVFCKSCGSPLFSARVDLSEVIRLRVGIVNEPLKAEISSHAFTGYKAAWFEILDKAPKFEESIC